MNTNQPIADYIAERRKKDRRTADIYVDAEGFLCGALSMLCVEVIAFCVYDVIRTLW